MTELTKENERYYIPNITEFHVGFEYEWLNKSISIKTRSENAYIERHVFGQENAKWKKRIYKVFDFVMYAEDLPVELNCYLQNYIDNNAIRVKYLDKSDIESLGFKESEYLNIDCYTLGNIDLFFTDDYISIDKFHNESRAQVFRGVIKNKSELKRLLTQLRIEV